VNDDGVVVNQSNLVERRGFRIPVWIWVIAAIGSAALLVVVILGWGHPRGATLRPMTASESMPEAQARAVADNTARAWLRERAALHLANLEALSCPDPKPNSVLAGEFDKVRQHVRPATNTDVVTTGMFNRKGPEWAIDVSFGDQWEQVEFRIVNGELRVSDMGAIPPMT
jgi:hypothetical protein